MTSNLYNCFLYKLFIGIVIVSMALPSSLVSAASLANPLAAEVAQTDGDDPSPETNELQRQSTSPPISQAIPQPAPFDSPLWVPAALETEEPPELPQPGSSDGRISSEGGRLASPDGKVQFEFPEAATKDALDLNLTTALPAAEQQPERSSQQQAQPEDQIWMLITLKPAGRSTSNAQTRLAQAATLSVDLSGIPAWIQPQLLRRDSDAKDAWVEQSASYDSETQLLSAKVDGLGEYAVALSSEPASEFPDTGTHYLMTNLPDVSSFSGAATYNYNLDLPAGRNGLAPALSLSYNSSGVNGMMGVVQSGDVGLGWSMGGTSSIVRVLRTQHAGGACSFNWQYPVTSCQEIWAFANDFSLILGGTSYTLDGPEKIGTDDGCRYYAEDAPQLLVMRYTESGDNNQYCGYGDLPAPPDSPDEFGFKNGQLSKEYWVVTTPEGTEYRMGFNDDSEQFVPMDSYIPDLVDYSLAEYGGEKEYGVAYRWSVDLVRDVYSNTMNYSYQEESYTSQPLNARADRAQHLNWILYTGRPEDPDSGPYLVDVVLENRTNQNDNGGGTPFDTGLEGETDLISWKPWVMWDLLRVDKVRVCNSPNDPGSIATTCPANGSLVEYDLDYDFVTQEGLGSPYIVGDQKHETTRLVSITKSGWDAAGVKKSLPAATFSYNTEHWMQGATIPVEYPRLKTANNGYSGTVEFMYTPNQYAFDGRTVNNYYVYQKQVSDGLGNTAKINYSYYDACFAGGGADCSESGDLDDSGALIGHARTVMQVIDYDGLTPLAYSESKFYTATGILQGKQYESAVYNANGLGSAQQKNTTTWGTRAFYGDTEFAYVAQTQSADLSGSDKVTTRSDFTYDEFNNTVAEYHYGAEALLTNPGFERETEGWTVISGTVSDEHAFAGFYSYRMQGGTVMVTPTITQTVGNLTIDNPHIGERYRLKAWSHRNSTSSGKVSLCYQDINLNWNCAGQQTPTSDEGKWTLLERDVYFYTDTVTVGIRHDGAAGDVFVDQLSVARVDNSGDERSVQRFFHNTNDPDNWCMGLPYGENLIEGIATNAMVAGTDAIKSKTRMYYDNNSSLTAPDLTHGRVTKQVQGEFSGGVPGANSVAVSYSYDDYGNVIQQTDAKGTTSTTEYETTYHQFPVRAYVTVNGTAQNSYTEYYGIQNVTTGGGYFGLFGQVKRTYGPNGTDTATSYSYDALGRQRMVVQAGDTITNPSAEIRYFDGIDYRRTDSGPFMVRQISRGESGVDWLSDPDGMATWTRTFYDGLGRPVQTHMPHTDWTPGTTTGQDIVVHTEYDALGRSIKQSVPEFKDRWQWTVTPEDLLVTSYHPTSTLTSVGSSTVYDVLGRPSQAIAPDGSTTKSFYNGLQTAVIDAESNMRISQRDSLGQVVKIKEYRDNYTAPNWTTTANIITTQYGYDVLGNLTSVKNTADPNTEITMTYDLLGRKTAMHDPDMGDWTYAYDDNGNLTQQTDARDCVTSFSYDELNRMQTKSYSAICPGSNPTVTYTYDDVTNNNYGIGQRTGMSDGSTSASWVYDDRGRVFQSTQTIAGQSYSYSTSYDGANRPLSVTYPDGEVLTTSYTMGGSPDGLSSSVYHTLVKDVAYNQRGQLDTLTYGNDVRTDYDYDELNHSFRLENLQASKGSDIWLDLTYQYDDVGNVKKIETASAGMATETFNYTYDAYNRLTKARGPGFSRDYGYNSLSNQTKVIDYTPALDWLTYEYGGASGGPHAVTGLTSKSHTITNTYEYDLNGNMITRTHESGDAYAFFYNANNKLESADLNGSTLLSNTYDGDGTLVQKTGISGTTTYVGGLYEIYPTSGGHAIRKTYTFGGQRVAVSNEGVLSYLHSDHLNSASLATDASGNKVSGSDTRYTPFGQTRDNYDGASLPTDRRYTGQREVADLGLYDYNARYYDPYIGRFIQADTIIPDPGSAQAYNRYSYAANNPLKYVDPTGHCATLADGSPDPADQTCWDTLNGLQDEYGITISNHTRWTVGSLSWLQDVFSNYEDFIGSDVFRSYVTGISFLIDRSIRPAAEWKKDLMSIIIHPEKAAFNGEWDFEMTEMTTSPQDAFTYYVTHELVHMLVTRFNDDSLIDIYREAAGWQEEETGYWFGIRLKAFKRPSLWTNPGTGPTKYARNNPDPEEDLAESFTSLMLPGLVADRSVTQDRENWINDWITDLGEHNYE